MFKVRDGCVFFLMTVCLTRPSIELDQGQADFESVYNFLVELRNNSGSMLEYVAKIQLIFCPDLPICDQEEGGTLTKTELLRTLPAILRTENRTIRIEDIPEFLGVCCLPCSCSESCYENDNCCSTKHHSLHLKDDNNTGQETLKTDCIAAFVKSYYHSFGLSSNYRRYFMVTKCFMNISDIATTIKCENPDSRNLNETGPVTSVRTGRTYWNIHCAICNSDGEDVLNWKSIVRFIGDIVYYSNDPGVIGYPKTFEELHNGLVQMGAIIYRPPENRSMEHTRCFDKSEVLMCDKNVTENKHGGRLLVDECQQFYNPVTINKFPYFNVFCFFCRENSIQTKGKVDCDWDSDNRFGQDQMTALLDYRTYGTKHAEANNPEIPETGNQACSCDEVYDTYQGTCRPIFCPVGEFLIGCECVQPMKNLSGMPIVLTLKIGFNDHRYQSVDIKIRALHRDLTKALRTNVEQISIEVFATFEQETEENMFYICIIVVRSNAGHDSKETVKPFLKYLDSASHLEVKVGKTRLLMTLVSTVVFWTETTDGVVVGFKAKDLADLDHDLLLIYFNDKLQQTLSGRYQLLSPLLYCMSVQLSENEFIEEDGLVIINRTSALMPVSKYYSVSQTEIRVCANQYLINSQPSGRKLNIAHYLLSGVCAVALYLFAFGIVPCNLW